MLTAPARYRIRIKGHLGPQWATWFEGLTMTWQEPGETVLTGRVVDQAALHGILNAIRDLGLPLLEVQCLES
jgi:hypothetical protein